MGGGIYYIEINWNAYWRATGTQVEIKLDTMQNTQKHYTV